MSSQKSKLIKRIYPINEINKIQKKINMLPNYKKVVAKNYMNIRLISVIIVFLITLLVFKTGYIYAPITGLVYYMAFDYLFLDRQLKKRSKKLEHEALHFFETLTLTLESGHNLEQALDITCFNVNSELSKEFKRSLIEMKFGKTLIEALESLKLRIPSKTINNIILNITQTSVFGSNILETMHNQIDFLREKQLLEVREQINKIPYKVSIISVIFIIPLILILILGPFLINLLK